MNIFGCNWRKLFQLYISVDIRQAYASVHTTLLPWRSFGCQCLVFKKQETVISILLNDIIMQYTEWNSYRFRSHFLNLNHYTVYRNNEN